MTHKHIYIPHPLWDKLLRRVEVEVEVEVEVLQGREMGIELLL